MSEGTYPKPPFSVDVIINNLFIRSEPSMKGETRGFTGKGAFTITEVNGGWGRLKSGAGWIYIANPNYCTILKPVKDYEKIGKLIESCITDIHNLESFKNLLECLGSAN